MKEQRYGGLKTIYLDKETRSLLDKLNIPWHAGALKTVLKFGLKKMTEEDLIMVEDNNTIERWKIVKRRAK